MVNVSKQARAQHAARAAQQRLARARQQQRRQRAGWVSAVAVAVLLVAGLAGVALWQANKPGGGATPAAATTDGGLEVGTGPVTVEIYLDFLCPACKMFDDAVRPMLRQYVDDEAVTVVYHPISILDQKTTTEYSTRAAGAAGCASDGGVVDEFVAVMMAYQPTEGSTGLSDDEIISLGASTGLTGESFGECVRDGTYRDWVRDHTNQAFDRGVQGTPTVFVDGTLLGDGSVEGLSAAIESAAAG